MKAIVKGKKNENRRKEGNKKPERQPFPRLKLC